MAGALRNRLVKVHRLGENLTYAHAMRMQNDLTSQLKNNKNQKGHLLLLQHKPLFTLGRLQDSRENLLFSEEEMQQRGATLHQSSRGGNVTFHGPGQLVAYPILHLANYKQSVRWYVEALEDVLIQCAGAFSLSARRGGGDETGVWIQDRKVAAIGVHASRWVTSHGVALNVATDLSFFDMIVPCGLKGNPKVTSLARELCRSISVDEASAEFESAFARVFDCELEE